MTYLVRRLTCRNAGKLLLDRNIQKPILYCELDKVCIVVCKIQRFSSTTQQGKNYSRITNAFMNRKLEYTERKVLRYPTNLMYSVVEDVNRYSEFVPWVRKSQVLVDKGTQKRAKLEVGFGKITEKYNSSIICKKPCYVKAVCTDGILFNQLLCIWHFTPGRTPNSCIIDFRVCFEFRSLLYSQIANMVFNEIVKTMIKAFEKRAHYIQELEKREIAKLSKKEID